MEESSRLRFLSDSTFYPTVQERLKEESKELVSSQNKAQNTWEYLKENLSKLNKAIKQKFSTAEFVRETGESSKSMRGPVNQLLNEVSKLTRGKTQSATTFKSHAEHREPTQYDVKCPIKPNGLPRKLFPVTTRRRFLLKSPPKFKR